MGESQFGKVHWERYICGRLSWVDTARKAIYQENVHDTLTQFHEHSLYQAFKLYASQFFLVNVWVVAKSHVVCNKLEFGLYQHGLLPEIGW